MGCHRLLNDHCCAPPEFAIIPEAQPRAARYRA